MKITKNLDTLNQSVNAFFLMLTVSTLVGCGGGAEPTSSNTNTNGTPSSAVTGSSNPPSNGTTTPPPAPTAALLSMTGRVTAAYQRTTIVSPFAYLSTPSWDANAVVSVKNNSSTGIYLTSIDGGFSIGICSPSNAKGQQKTLTGVGVIDQGYLQPNYPYTLPIAQFTYVPANSSINISVNLQGCSVAYFSQTSPTTNIAIALAYLQNDTLSRQDVVVIDAPISFL
jgi:hypothetical protein